MESEVIQIANLFPTAKFDNPHRGRIYWQKGISPCLNTMGGGGLQPKYIVIAPQTKSVTEYKMRQLPVNALINDIAPCVTTHYAKVGVHDILTANRLRHFAIMLVSDDK